MEADCAEIASRVKREDAVTEATTAAASDGTTAATSGASPSVSGGKTPEKENPFATIFRLLSPGAWLQKFGISP